METLKHCAVQKKFLFNIRQFGKEKAGGKSQFAILSVQNLRQRAGYFQALISHLIQCQEAAQFVLFQVSFVRTGIALFSSPG